MASTSKGSLSSSSSSKGKTSKKPVRTKHLNQESVDQFCAVTGADEGIAHQMLEACQGNLEMAVNMHVDSADTAAAAASNDENMVVEEGEVRAPIPPIQAVLVEDAYGFGFRGRKRPSQSVFDGFRDFQAEAKWQEQELGNNAASVAARKRKTLEDLFRPPLDLIHRGSFETARDVGQIKNRWLMVNVQNGQEFSCQVLNRDVWSNPAVKSLIKEHFVFWQIYHDSEEGQRFSQFYKVLEFPYVAVLDPRTGEKMLVWNKVDSLSFCDSVTEYLNDHSTPDGTAVSSTVKKLKPESIVDVSEEQQILAAIQASLAESKDNDIEEKEEEDPSSSDVESSVDLETFDSDHESAKPANAKPTIAKHTNGKVEAIQSGSSKCQASMPSLASFNNNETETKLEMKSGVDEKEWRQYLGPESDPKSELMLRFPDGTKKQVSFPCSSQLKALLLFIKSQGYPEEDYEIVTTFPRREVNTLNRDRTLQELNLFPRETLYVQQKNA